MDLQGLHSAIDHFLDALEGLTHKKRDPSVRICAICYRPIEDGNVVLARGAVYHEDCYL